MASFINSVSTGLNSVSNAVNNASQVLQSAISGAPISNGGDNTLPSSQVPNYRTGVLTRNIIHWFVPEFGVIKMYVNPNNIQYKHRKLIQKERTKGGYNVQYWGSDFTVLSISGTTGSSGIEGINVLEEVYRAEQIAFDPVGQSLTNSNPANGANAQIIGGIGNSISQTLGSSGSSTGSSVGGGNFGNVLGSGLAQGIFGANTFTSLAPRNIPSLAELAFGVEMFYNGWIFRGFFEDMNITESSTQIGLFEYTISFTTTQRQGYRINEFAWQRSANSGPSNNSMVGGVPLSWGDEVSGGNQ